MFNTSNHTLYLHDSINGDLEEVGKFTNIEMLKETIYYIYSPKSDIITFFQEEFSL